MMPRGRLPARRQNFRSFSGTVTSCRKVRAKIALWLGAEWVGLGLVRTIRRMLVGRFFSKIVHLEKNELLLTGQRDIKT